MLYLHCGRVGEGEGVGRGQTNWIVTPVWFGWSVEEEDRGNALALALDFFVLCVGPFSLGASFQ